MRLIDADAFVEWIDIPHFEKQKFSGKEVLKMILKQPTVPHDCLQKHGGWKRDEDGEIYCSECDVCVAVGDSVTFDNIRKSNKYCLNCGCRMDGDKLD